MFLLWKGFNNKFMQIYNNMKEKETVIKKLYKLRQTSSAMMYMTKFQLLLI